MGRVGPLTSLPVAKSTEAIRMSRLLVPPVQYRLPEAVTPREPAPIPLVSNSGAPSGMPFATGTAHRPLAAPRSLEKRRYLPSGDQPIINSLLGPTAAAT